MQISFRCGCLMQGGRQFHFFWRPQNATMFARGPGLGLELGSPNINAMAVEETKALGLSVSWLVRSL